MLNPYNDDNKALVDACKIIIIRHEELREECTCFDADDDSGCWYRLSDKEQQEQRIDYLIEGLKEIKSNLKEEE